MGKGEISWKGRTAEGVKREVNARRSGGEWKFYVREKRYDQWQLLPRPPIEDWLELLDGVQRRIARRLLRPEEEARVKKIISERFPGTEF
ncbi:MAG: hypothetical protein AB9869_28110 [Verrucomicrobiia bacterium]